ncbi:MAG TPA: nickel-dependent hydrogenase large subunit, partial [Bacteroidota bacterium]|nr:nickel-dependent hydrogenase large subunit [Bacteroidota bacterium]
FPDFEYEYEFVALRSSDEYPMNEGRVGSSSGLDIPVREYEFHFEERHVQHSNALHSTQRGKGPYTVGPLARFNLNFDRLSTTARQVAEDLGVTPPVRNPFRSIIVRAIETIVAFDEALRIVEHYEKPPRPAVGIQIRPGVGCAATEAPRGLLYHRYRVGDDGKILDAKIVPPTAQNQPTIENDLRLFVSSRLDLPRAELTLRTEQAVRNYDPCISCATHFVTLDYADG